MINETMNDKMHEHNENLAKGRFLCLFRWKQLYCGWIGGSLNIIFIQFSVILWDCMIRSEKS